MFDGQCGMDSDEVKVKVSGLLRSATYYVR